MAQQLVGIGTLPNDGTGDPLRDAFDKLNDNDTELYGRTAAASATSSGIVELATTAETITGTDTVRAITPAALAGFFANGHIPFPATQNPSADANTLDDYEEGTWTPAVTFGGGATGVTYSTQAGKYTKVGRVVTLSDGRLILTNKGSSTGAALITGLPFTASGSCPLNLVAITGFTLTAGMNGYTSSGGTSIVPRIPNTTGSGSMTDTQWSNTSDVIISGSYTV